MARGQKLLYVGTNRFVAAIDPGTGEERWRTKLPHGSGTVVTLVIKGRNLFVGHAGHAYCLDKRSGEIVWENGLPKMGYHSVLMAMEGAQAASSGGVPAAAAEQQRRQAAASSSAQM